MVNMHESGGIAVFALLSGPTPWLRRSAAALMLLGLSSCALFSSPLKGPSRLLSPVRESVAWGQAVQIRVIQPEQWQGPIRLEGAPMFRDGSEGGPLPLGEVFPGAVLEAGGTVSTWPLKREELRAGGTQDPVALKLWWHDQEGREGFVTFPLPPVVEAQGQSEGPGPGAN